MQLVDRSPTAHTAAPDSAASTFVGANLKAYQRLKLAFSLNLRRQIFLAVCDDLALRNRIAARLYAELAYPIQKSAVQPSLTTGQSFDRRSPLAYEANSSLADAAEQKSPLPLTYPCLVSLNLNMSEPNPMVQIAEWLAQYPPPQSHQQGRSPGFQILGTERLTRQSALTQKRFLNSLQQIEHYLSCLESPLLLWLPRPWLHAVQQSAPDFWNWHTALFEFEGDPTPVPVVNKPDEKLSDRPSLAADQTRTVMDDLTGRSDSGLSDHFELETQASTAKSTIVEASEAVPATAALSALEISSIEAQPTPQTPSSQQQSQKETVWQILTEDLAHLNEHLLPNLPNLEETSEETDRHPIDDIAQSIPTQSIPAQPATHPPALVQTSQTDDRTSAPTTESSTATVAPSAGEPSSVNAPTPAIAPRQIVASSRPSTSALTQTRFALDLSDLVLAAAAQDTSESPGKHSEPIQTLQHIEQLHLKQAPRAALAAAYQNFGALYRDRIEQGEASEQTLIIAIRAYEHALEWLDEPSPLCSDVLNDIGNLYWMRSRGASDADLTVSHLETAIATYQQALAQTNPETRPHSYAMIQNNLGSAYGDLARYQNPVECLPQSVQAYEEALRYRKLEDDPARYAATQNNLGTTYWNFAQHQQPVLRLKQAIAAYTEALRYYSPEQEPMHYAMIQNNLGTAYWNLAQQEQSSKDEAGRQNAASLKLLLRAIAAYRAALTYRTLEVAPTAYAATQNNLGTAHWQVANLSNIHLSKRREQLQQAIAAYKAALVAIAQLSATSTAPISALTFDQFATRNNLGLAHYQLAIDQEQSDPAIRTNLLESALNHHLEALQGWRSQPDLCQAALGFVIQTIRTFHSEFGIKGQSTALSKIPANLLPEVMKRL